jgi:endonuclease G
MKRLLLILLFVPTVALAQIAAQCPQFLAYAAPYWTAKAGDQELCKTNYAVIHRCETKTPVAVFEHITREKISGAAHRQDDFRPDPAVHEACRAQLRDYAGNPYDRGHMAAAGNSTQNAAVMSESFFLSNMVPQVPNNNRGAWKQLETWVRDWVDEGRDLHVISGAIYDRGYTTIGNSVGVPTRLYKIVIDKQKNTSVAWILPNGPLPVADLPKFQTTVAEVERATGIQFNIKH